MNLSWRALFASLVVPALLSAGVAPVLHAHEADADHPHTVVHRHTRAHASGHANKTFAHANISDRDLSDHDEDTVWMDSRTFEPTRNTINAGPAGISTNFSFTPALAGLSLAVRPEDSLPHGPPGVRPRFRAPPIPTV